MPRARIKVKYTSRICQLRMKDFIGNRPWQLWTQTKKMRKEKMKGENTFRNWIRTHDLWDSDVPLQSWVTLSSSKGSGAKKITLLSLLMAENSKNLNNCQIEFWDEKSPKRYTDSFSFDNYEWDCAINLYSFPISFWNSFPLLWGKKCQTRKFVVVTQESSVKQNWE